jgi:xylan 1,4-beta-xylosidase
MRKRVENPVLKGFHPDPAIICVGETYYLATSTFEWYPGVRIYQSEDLAEWSLASAPLDNLSLLDMRGIGSSDGIWAPDLTWHGGRFYLVYTVVRSRGRIKDMNNYVVRADSVKGPWSAPAYLNSSGFDPSLYHGDDGRKWLLNMQWDYRKGNGPECFTGILMQEYDEEKKRLIGEPEVIFKGTGLGYTEGPHLYRHGEYYYLICAEGGTSYEHAVTVARSRDLTGPYEVDPENPILTSKDSCRLKKAGHASICQAKDGSWYLAHLCGRPLPGTRSCVLGREAAIQEVVWTEAGWLRLKNGTNSPGDSYSVEMETSVSGTSAPAGKKEYRFEDSAFLGEFQTLRLPRNEKTMSLTARPGWLRLTGKEGIQSRFEQTLLARRQTDFCFRVETRMEYAPEDFRHSAGLIYRYNENNLYYLYVTYQESMESPVLAAASVYDGEYRLFEEIPLKGPGYTLGIQVQETKGQFYYVRGEERRLVGPEFDVTNLSDDFTYGFTGAFVGVCAQDLRDHRKTADFQWFTYESV